MPKSVSGARFARTISREPSLLLTNSTKQQFCTDLNNRTSCFLSPKNVQTPLALKLFVDDFLGKTLADISFQKNSQFSHFYRSDGVAINTLSAAKGYNMVVSGDITKQLMAKILNPKVLFYGNRGE